MQIKIDSVSEDAKKVTLISGKLKYSFWKTKQNGEQTKAYAQFSKYGFKSGEEVNVEVAEEDRTFTNEKGKEVTYKQRTILYFQEIENVPIVRTAEKVEKADTNQLNRIESKIDELLSRAKGEDIESVPF